MMKLKEFNIDDCAACKSDQELSPEDVHIISTTHGYHLRTVFDTNTTEVIAILMVFVDGDVGMVVNNGLLRGRLHEFYILSIVFLVEALSHIDGDSLYCDVTTPRNHRWVRHLGFSLMPASTNRYTLPLSRWLH